MKSEHLIKYFARLGQVLKTSGIVNGKQNFKLDWSGIAVTNAERDRKKAAFETGGRKNALSLKGAGSVKMLQ